MMVIVMLVVAIVTAFVASDAYEDGDRKEAYFWGILGIVLEVMTYFSFVK